MNIVAVSDGYLRATLTKREKILGHGILEVFPDNPDDPAATGVRNLRASLERVLRNKVSDTMAVQKYDIRKPESEGGGFEERYWSPVNSPVFGPDKEPDKEIAYIIHRVEDVTEFVRLKQQGIEQNKLTQELRARAEQMEAEGYLRAREVQDANRQLEAANQELTRAEEASRLLAEVAESARSAETVDAAISRSLATICKLKGWQLGQAWLLDDRENVLISAPGLFHADFECAAFRKRSLETRFQKGVGLPGRVWEANAPAWIVDVTQDTDFPRAPLARDTGLSSAFAFPIRYGQTLFAVFEFFTPETRDPDPHFLEAVNKLGFRLGEVFERKRTRAALRASEERYRALAETAKDAIISADQEGNIIHWNGSAERMFGYTLAEALAKCLTLIIPERFQDAHQQGFKRHLETGEAHVMGKTVELAGRRKDGTEFPLELSLASWGTSEGIFFTGIIRDITERKRAEGALHESEQRFHAFWDNSPSLNFLKDVEGRYLNVNKEFERALRVSREQIKGKRDDEVFPPEQAAAFQANDQQVLRTGAPMEFEEVSLQEDGPHTNIVHKFPLLDAEGEVYATGGIARDITERKRVEEALRHGEETLRLLVDGVKDHALFMLDPEGRVASWNTGAERIKGYRAEEIIGQDSSRFFTPEDIEQGKPEL
ncbi:MAG: hypothetical protein DMG25_09110, partial [Acidobacteria bacterium]